MSLSVQRDIGTLLVKVQDDLRRLRNVITEKDENGEKIDLSVINSAIADTEQTIREHVEHVVHVKNNDVKTLPMVIDDTSSPHQAKLPPIQRKQIKSTATTQVSPGENTQLMFISKLLTQPNHPTTRQLLHDTYGIQVPTDPVRRKDKTRKGDLVSGTTVAHLDPLPIRNRREATLTPPPITSKDIQKGLLNLLERGLIPKSANIILDPPLVQNKHAQLHEFDDDKFKERPVDAVEGGTALSGVKFDIQSCTNFDKLNNKTPSDPKILMERQTPSTKSVMLNPLPIPPITCTSSPEQPSEVNIATEAQNEASSILKISIRGGSLLRKNEDYKKCEDMFRENWENINRFLERIERLAREYDIQVVLVDGKKVSDLASEYELEPIPSYKDLLPCILNSREVSHILHIPGRRYRAKDGTIAAVCKIQATFRMFMDRMKYLEHRRMKWAAGIIAMGWVLYVESCKIRQQLKKSRDLNVRNYRTRLLELKGIWETMKTSHRVIIHLPSRGYCQKARKQTNHFSITQNFQMGRVCDVLDPNVTVIYVCPIELHGDEIFEYYEGLVGPDMIAKQTLEGWDRVFFVTPEYLDSFGHHHLPLSSLLKYSTKAVKHIKRLVGGRQAYIMPHIPDRDDLDVSNTLDIPLLGAEPDLVKLYSTHSGRHQLFREGEVTTPPNVREIYSLDQLLDSLAVLILNNLYVRRWIFKIDHHIQGKGIAYCELTPHLDCYSWIVKESIRYGDKWNKQWAQEYSRQRLMHELPAKLAMHAKPIHTNIYPTWEGYLKEFIIAGGSIEASPPSDSVTGITVDIFLDPVGGHRLLSSWDQIYCGPYQVWGGTIPQTSINPKTIEKVVEGVAKSAKARGLVGYLSVDLVTFIHPSTMKQIVWAVDIDFGPSDIASLHTLITNLANVPPDSISSHGKLLTIDGNEERYIVVSTRLRHTNMSLIQFNVFLRMCKAHMIAYNQQQCIGTVFTPIESSQKQYLGMICIQSSLKEALSCTSNALSTIHQEISTSNIQGQTNYPIVYKDIQSIVRQIETNEAHISGEQSIA